MAIYSAGSASVKIVPDFSDAQKSLDAWFARQGNISVKVKPELDDADVARTRAELGAVEGTAKLHVDEKGFKSELARTVKDSVDVLTGFTDSLTKLVNSVVPVTLITTAVGGLAEVLASATSALGILNLIPAAVAGIAAPLATVVIGFQGMATAFKALKTGDVAKIQQAMAGLAPSARQFVTAIHDLAPAFTGLRLDVQQALFAGLGKDITHLADSALPTLRSGFVQIAQALNGGLVTGMNNLAGDTKQFQTIFTDVARAVKTVTGSALPLLIQDFVNLAALGAQFLPQLVQGFTTLVQVFTAWVNVGTQTGHIVGLIEQAINTLTQFGLLAANVSKIVNDVLAAALPYGNQLVVMLVGLTAQLDQFLSTVGAQNALKTFFADVLAVARALLPVVLEIVEVFVSAVLPAVGDLASALAPVIAELGQSFVSVIQRLSTIVPPLSTAIADMVSALAPLIPVTAQLLTTLLPPLVKVLDGFAGVVEKLAEDVGDALLSAADALAPVLPVLGNAFVAILAAVEPLIPPILRLVVALLPPLVTIITELTPAVVTLVGAFAKLALPLENALLPVISGLAGILAKTLGPVLKALGPYVKDIAAAFVLWVAAMKIAAFVQAASAFGGMALQLGVMVGRLPIVTAATKAWAAAQGLLDAVMDANPIALVVIAVAALVAGVVIAAEHCKAFRDALLAAWHDIVNFFTGPFVAFFTTTLPKFWENAWNVVKNFFVSIWTDIRNWFVTTIIGWFTGPFVSFFTKTIPGAWSTAWTAVRNFFVSIWSALVTWARDQLAAFVGFWQNTWTTVRNFFVSTWDAVKNFFVSTWDSISSWFSGVLASFKNTFLAVWHDIENGVIAVWDGIKSAAETAWNALKAIVEAPIKFVVNTVVDGFISGVNAVLRFLHLPWQIPLVHLGFAEGGFTGEGVFGTGGKYDPAGIVHAREFVVNADQTAKHLPLLQAINSGVGGFAEGGYAGPLPGYSLGGLVDDIFGLITDPVGTLTKFLESFGSGKFTGKFWDFLISGGVQMVQHIASTIGSDIKNAIISLFSNPDPSAHPNIPDVQHVLSAVGLQQATAAGTGVSNLANAPQANVIIVHNVASGFGWGTGLEWTDLVNVIMRESGFRNTAQNPTSTAYGMFQFLNSTWASFGPKTSDPTLQAKYGLEYIAERYGDPINAWAHEVNFGWYDSGGYLPPGWSTVYNGTGSPEVVLNPAQQNALQQALSGRSGGAMGTLTGSLYLADGTFLGLVRGITKQVVAESNAAFGRDLRSAR